MPPWEAWCHEHAGFYQDFYRVHWQDDKGTAWAGMNLSKVENGAAEAGSTWEPDDCIPASLDGMRLREKTRWLKRKHEQEQKEKAEKDKEEAERRPEPPPAKMARYKRNGDPLLRDMFRLKRGHDFNPPQADKDPDVRSGWPKRAEDRAPIKSTQARTRIGISHINPPIMKLPKRTIRPATAALTHRVSAGPAATAWMIIGARGPGKRPRTGFLFLLKALS